MADDGDDWRFDEDDFHRDGRDSESDERDEGEATAIFGSTDSDVSDPEPGSPSAESVFFVLLGVATVVGIIALLVV